MSAGPRNVSEKRSIPFCSSGRVVHPFTSTNSNSTGLGASARTRNFVFRCFENSSSDMLTGVILTQRGTLYDGARTPHNSAAAHEIGRAHAELQSRSDLVCRLLLEKKKKKNRQQQ